MTLSRDGVGGWGGPNAHWAGARSNPSPGQRDLRPAAARAPLATRLLPRLQPTTALRSVKRLVLIAILGLAPRLQAQSPAFARFVDRYLDDFARRHPSIAAGNGIHDHDDRLDDFSAAGIAAEIKALEADAVQLRAFDSKQLTPDERVDQRILLGIIDGWLLEQKTLQNWRRNPCCMRPRSRTACTT